MSSQGCAKALNATTLPNAYSAHSVATLLMCYTVPAVHLDSAGGSMSYSQMRNPSLHNLGLRKVKHVQFVHNDNPKEALRAGLWNRFLALFHSAGLVMRRLDELRVFLCLYEVVMLPMRLAFGTGYGLLDAARQVVRPARLQSFFADFVVV